MFKDANPEHKVWWPKKTSRDFEKLYHLDLMNLRYCIVGFNTFKVQQPGIGEMYLNYIYQISKYVAGVEPALSLGLAPFI